VTQFLAAIDQETDLNAFTGELRFGIRYQTNANSAPLDDTIVLNGLPFQLDTAATGRDDFNVYGAAIMNFSHDLQNQGDRFDVALVAYGAKQFEVDELDAALAEVNIGPTFDLGRFGYDNADLGVYAIGSGIFLDDDFYSAAGGAGARLVATPSNRTTTSLRGEYRRRFYFDSSSSPRASDRDGDEYRGVGSLSYLLQPDVAVSVVAQVERETAEEDYHANWETSGALGTTIAMAPPFGDVPWTLGLYGGASWRLYDDPDPVINAAEEEEDIEGFFRGSLNVPIRNRWSVLGEGEYRIVDSNYPTRDFDNFSVIFSLVKGW
jgi:hypothetical protein